MDFLSLIDMCMSTNVRKLSRIVTRIYDSYLKPSGININQLAIMLTIKGMQDHNDGKPSIGDAATRLAMEKSTFSRNLRVLEDLDFIKLQISSTSRSQKVISVTENGMEMIMNAYTYWDEVQHIIKTGIGEEKFMQTIAITNEIESFLIDRFGMN